MMKSEYDKVETEVYMDWLKTSMKYWRNPEVKGLLLWEKHNSRVKGLKEGFVIGTVTTGIAVTAIILLL